MGLAFLNKKSWHTGSFQNIEKVWIAEQKKKDQDRRQGELLKKLKEERHLEEMKKLQVEAGLIPASHLNRMDWMYQGVNKLQEKQNEDYILGKKLEEKDLEKKPQQTGGFTPLYKEEIGNIKNEEFTRLHEDPLFMIKQEEMKRKKEIIENPIKMKDIYAELEKISQKKPKSKKKKERKKEKKEKKKEKEENQEKQEKKEKLEKKDKKKKKEKKEEKDKKKGKKEKYHRHDTESESSSSRSRSRSQSKKIAKVKSEEAPVQSKFYEEYLKKRLGPILIKDEEGNLKPDFTLYKKKKAQSEIASRMTTDEKIEKLNQMKEEAEKFKKEKMKQHKRDFPETKNEKPEFISDLKKEIYTKEKGINELGDRMKSHRSYFSRIKEESNTFKKS